MSEKKDQGQALSDEDKDILAMLNLEGRHEGHSLRRVGLYWVCSCHKEVLRVA